MQAREGLADVIGGLYGRMMSWREVTRVLYWPGSLDAPQESKRGKIATEEWNRVMEAGGKLPVLVVGPQHLARML